MSTARGLQLHLRQHFAELHAQRLVQHDAQRALVAVLADQRDGLGEIRGPSRPGIATSRWLARELPSRHESQYGGGVGPALKGRSASRPAARVPADPPVDELPLVGEPQHAGNRAPVPAGTGSKGLASRRISSAAGRAPRDRWCAGRCDSSRRPSRADGHLDHRAAAEAARARRSRVVERADALDLAAPARPGRAPASRRGCPG